MKTDIELVGHAVFVVFKLSHHLVKLLALIPCSFLLDLPFWSDVFTPPMGCLNVSTSAISCANALD